MLRNKGKLVHLAKNFIKCMGIWQNQWGCFDMFYYYDPYRYKSFLILVYMIPIACKIPNTCSFTFWKHNNIMIGLYYCTWCFKTRNGEHAPQWLIIGKPISQYASYKAMFCLLHSSIRIEQHEKHLCIYPAITENTEDTLVKHASHISMHESITPRFQGDERIMASVRDTNIAEIILIATMLCRYTSKKEVVCTYQPIAQVQSSTQAIKATPTKSTPD